MASSIDETIGGRTASTTGEASRPSARGTTVLRRGDTLSRYVVLEEIGRGAMGVVYVAIDPDLERRVALKVLHREQARLVKEARALARLSHPNVVAVHDVGESDGRFFVAMEYVEGQSVDRWLAAADRGWTQVLDVFIPAGRGLAAAHSADLIHRDFKPANVMLAADGRVKVTDFGLARPLAGAAIDLEVSGSSSAMSMAAADLAATHAATGTPAYMAPELHRGGPADAASDQFAFCVSLHQALFGRLPFAGDDLPSLIAAIVEHRLVEPTTPGGVPTRLRRAVARGLAADPRARHSGMDALVGELERIRTPSRRRVWIAVGALTVGAAAWGAAASVPTDPCVDAGDAAGEAWNAQRSAALVDAFGRTALEFSGRAAAEATTTLDDYTARWRELAESTCREGEGARDPAAMAVLAPTAQCLQRALVNLRAVSDRLAGGDRGAVTHAVELVHGLPPLGHCSDPVLASTFPIPDDPALRDEVERLRSRLAQFRTRRLGEDPEIDDAEVEAIADEAEALGFAPLTAEVALERGEVLLRRDRVEDAAAMFERALQLAIEGDADFVAAITISRLLSIDGDDRGEHRRASAWEQLARGFIERWPPTAEPVLDLYDALGRLLSNRGEYDEAVRLSKAAADLASDLDQPVRETNAVGNYGLVLMRAGRYDEAREIFEAQVEDAIALYGPDHPMVGWTWNALGVVNVDSGRLEEAEHAYRRAVDLYSTDPKSIHDLAQAEINLANVLSRRGDGEVAIELTLKAIDHLRAHQQGDHPTLAIALNNLGTYTSALRRKEEAADWYRQALEMRTRLGDPPLALIAPTANLGSALADLGDEPAARHHFEAVLELVRTALPPDHPTAARVHGIVGAGLLALKDADAALPHLEKAERMLAAVVDPDAQELVNLRVGLQEARDAARARQ